LTKKSRDRTIHFVEIVSRLLIDPKGGDRHGSCKESKEGDQENRQEEEITFFFSLQLTRK
jgi:hypothetical protein